MVREGWLPVGEAASFPVEMPTSAISLEPEAVSGEAVVV
jgi:hypothetical protein